MLNIGPPELILIFVIALVIVGPQRLPELGRTIGKGLREFRKMQDEVKDLVNTGMGDEFKQTAAELRRTASDLKSATDVRSAFRNDTPRTRPHGPVPDEVADEAIAPEPDSDVPEPPTPAPASPVDTDDTGSDE
ncbi:MAG: Sec-independent protein translocase subunit TatA/TatB [Actinomycetota bacterium]